MVHNKLRSIGKNILYWPIFVARIIFGQHLLFVKHALRVLAMRIVSLEQTSRDLTYQTHCYAHARASS